MVLFLKCNICQTMVHIEEIKSHKITKKHKSRIQLLDIIESLKEKIYNNDYDDEEIDILYNHYSKNPFNMDMDLVLD